jgi:rfaE bifunctional protein nucleotidyltransferase chain/domain
MPMSKIVSLDELRTIRESLRRERKTVVLTNGCFDLLHVGHARCLRAARALGDVLIVGLNSDRSVRAFKEPGHPVVPEPDRAELLAALEPVDYVVLFDEATAERLVEALRPDVYAKGGDYTIETLPEAKAVLACGGRIEFLPLVPGISTTQLIETIVAHFARPTNKSS